MCDSAYVRFRHPLLCVPANEAHRRTMLRKSPERNAQALLRTFDGTARPTALQTTGELT
ncbi:protein of unknown function (plasmid) [Caballeronia sp. S22]